MRRFSLLVVLLALVIIFSTGFGSDAHASGLGWERACVDKPDGWLCGIKEVSAPLFSTVAFIAAVCLFAAYFCAGPDADRDLDSAQSRALVMLRHGAQRREITIPGPEIWIELPGGILQILTQAQWHALQERGFVTFNGFLTAAGRRRAKRHASWLPPERLAQDRA